MVGQRFTERRPSGKRDWCRRVVVTKWPAADAFYRVVEYSFVDCGKPRRSSTGLREFLKRFEAEGQSNSEATAAR